MTDTNQKEARMALFLAERMGLKPIIGEFSGKPIINGGDSHFTPVTSKKQFASVVLWAARNGLSIRIDDEVSVFISATQGSVITEHDNTDESIMRATIEAICRACGFEGE